MRKKKATRKHTVWANVQVVELSKAGSAMDFEIYADNEKLGHITIGRGSFTWYGKGKQIGRSFSWTKFASEMNKLCYDE